MQFLLYAGTPMANDPDAYARFELKRTYYEEYVDFSNVSPEANWVKITLDTGDGNPQTLRVPEGWTMHIRGFIKAGANAQNIRFTQTAGEDIVYSYDNTSGKDQHAFDISFTY